jgi:hypothetical protein
MARINEVRVRLTDDEKVRLKGLCKISGMNASTYIRYLCFNTTLKSELVESKRGKK